VRTLFLALALLMPTSAGARAEIPIHEVDLRSGARRYAVTLTIDGKPVEVGLDTGSVGLRVLPRALGDAARAAKGGRISYSYGAGTQFDGAAIKVAISAGGISAPITIMRIDRIGCNRQKPNCAAGRSDPTTFGIQGDGVAGQGFAAILGIRLQHDAIENPFRLLGVKRWLVELPRPGDAAGRLVLDPDDSEIANYQRIALDDYGRTAGCLVGPPPLKVCGPAFFDSGAPGLRIFGDVQPQRWPDGTPIQIAVGDGKALATMDVIAGRRDQASGIFYEPTPAVPQVRLSLGLAPYFHWSVLYDADRKQIGLRPR
jgi:hypothetical protein